MGHSPFRPLQWSSERGRGCDVWRDGSCPWRIRSVEPVRPHLADLVAGGRGWGINLHPPAFAVGGESLLEVDEASIRGSSDFACLADDHCWNCLWGFLPRGRERRSLDVSLHAVARLDRLSLRPARILSRSLPAFGDCRRWNRTGESALRSRDAKRFASSPAIFPWRHGLDD